MSFRCRVFGHNKVTKPFVAVERLTSMTMNRGYGRIPMPIYGLECTHCGNIWMAHSQGAYMDANRMFRAAWNNDEMLLSWSTYSSQVDWKFTTRRT